MTPEVSNGADVLLSRVNTLLFFVPFCKDEQESYLLYIVDGETLQICF